MKRFMRILKVEGKVGLRCPDAIFFGVCMPMGIMILLGILYGKNSSMITSSFGALVTVGVCATAFMGMPLTIAEYRDKKILKHFFVTPTSPFLILAVQTAIQILLCLVSAAGVWLVAKLVFGYQMKGLLAAFVLAYLYVMLALYSLGMVIASLCKNAKVTNVVCSIVYFPMLFLSGATIPYEIFPHALKNVANILPLTQGIKLLKGISMGYMEGGYLVPILVLSVCIVLGTVISAKTFRWE